MATRWLLELLKLHKPSPTHRPVFDKFPSIESNALTDDLDNVKFGEWEKTLGTQNTRSDLRNFLRGVAFWLLKCGARLKEVVMVPLIPFRRNTVRRGQGQRSLF